ncbi:MAG: tRNA (adenosine(37)-N6)-threonylcarbamoyltransferase complex ATPase subunit type 1 TsaE [Gemmatimonadales bacterium]|nr:MAG: tRNA (adenosine(37)-N6)-threonylcarbamoyltransferase complex ATPase subunit type 1 TsaE [Gemmatimonadales bacterium]
MRGPGSPGREGGEEGQGVRGLGPRDVVPECRRGGEAVILSEGDLILWGERIGGEVERPVFLGLRGQLGAGKSVLARAIARGAGVEGTMPSPTFNLLFRYEGRDGQEVVHMDLYRLRDPEELWELGWEELGHGPELVLVEWPERAGDHLPEDRWDIHLTLPDPGSAFRRVQVHRSGAPPHLPGFPVQLESS